MGFHGLAALAAAMMLVGGWSRTRFHAADPVAALSSFPDPMSGRKSEFERGQLLARDAGYLPPTPQQEPDATVTSQARRQDFLQTFSRSKRFQARKPSDLVEMAINDIQKEHEKRMSRLLKDDMDNAAKQYADMMTKEISTQNAYVRSRRRALQLARQKEKAREKAKAAKDPNANWLSLF
ncbi:hypothetical protein GUITHDRAFT_150360 [Guillardia theta CCMP2712]|uniref:Uncharacterized protein n=1 Tax=Guillardia theta (strain CCMP2712) TaxID=905079 RepID=L1JXH9_GUITC|nr:hypothetical protein GUITHDRAFT_150360 [Guillardia theta CCMP2712]EKX53266.1 hypothetical protein GUITHDRAFT_150360 [Guillardia theta CCMP2712]|eukprot:XP_005840246.1 hypothetical protein GUITHDRAFT_150360 [Guillardia theta CCMP2712]